MFRKIATSSTRRSILRIIAVSGILLLSTLNLNAKTWRGIVPLKSSRADVEQLLGLPGEHGRYQFENERAYVEYTSGSCHGRDNCLCLIPKDTVLNVYVEMETVLRFSSIKLDKRRCKKFVSPERPQFVTYTNREEGIIYTVDRTLDEVIAIDYRSTAEDCEAIFHKVVSFSFAEPQVSFGSSILLSRSRNQPLEDECF